MIVTGTEDKGLLKSKTTSSAYKKMLCIFALILILVIEVLDLILFLPIAPLLMQIIKGIVNILVLYLY